MSSAGFVVGMGVDPGMAAVGMAVVHLVPGGKPILAQAHLEVTKRSSKKELRRLRVTGDDQRRLREIWDTLHWFSDPGKGAPVESLGVEAFHARKGKGGGSSAKVAQAYQLAVCWGWHTKVGMVSVFVPQDLRRRFLKSQKGSKADLEDVLTVEIEGLLADLDRYAKDKREHVVDAAGYAVLAAEELVRARKELGFPG